MPYLLIALLIALIMDYVYPMHRGLMYLIHPVHLTYSIATRLYRPYSSRPWGVAIWFASTLPVLLIYAAPLIMVPLVNAVIEFIMLIYVGFIIKLSISLKLLLDIVNDYINSIKINDLSGARGTAQQLVRRNVWVIDEAHVNSAVIESLFESLVDGFSSPLFYLILFGPVGALLQRLSNTMDSALGYTDEPYRRVGWFSAKVDTILNYVPARLTALVVMLAGLIIGRRPNVKVYLRYRSATRSLNAGHPMAAAASVLNITLEKIGEYRIGHGQLPNLSDLLDAVKLAKAASILIILITVLCLIPISSIKLGFISVVIRYVLK